MMLFQSIVMSLMISTILSHPSERFDQTSVRSFTKINGTTILSTIESNNYKQKFMIKSITSVPFYRMVSYFTNRTEESEDKVHDLDIPHDLYYTHIYLAWKIADKLMSSVAVQSNMIDSNLSGANLVISIDKLGGMYAPGLITRVLEFVTKCYDWAKPKLTLSSHSTGYISTLRVATSDEINKALIKRTTEQFLEVTTSGSYHFVWEQLSKTDQFMKSLNYERITCGNNKGSSNPCDWTKLGLSPEKAADQCLYQLINS